MYSKKQFDQCVFNPLAEGKMLGEYPKLSEIVAPEWVDENLDSILRFVICTYDAASPLIKGERDLNYRRNAALDICEIKDENLIDQLTSHTHIYAVDLILKYLIRFSRSKEWMMIVALEFKFCEAIKLLIQPISGKTSKEELEGLQKKSLVADELDKDAKRIEILYKLFFGGDEDIEQKVRKRGMSPELIAIYKNV